MQRIERCPRSGSGITPFRETRCDVHGAGAVTNHPRLKGYVRALRVSRGARTGAEPSLVAIGAGERRGTL
jgi:hypothetical protein